MKLLRLIAINFALLCSLLVIFFVLVPVLTLAFTPEDSPDDEKIALPNYREAEWAAVHFAEWEALETEYHSFVGWRRKPVSGETIVIEGPYAERRTPLPPDAKGPVVFFFGGSTMWGTGGRDEDTIPALYARATGRIARNFGESGYIIHQNLEMLLWLLSTGQRPDIVVFYDGVNDVSQKCDAGHNLFDHAQEGRIVDSLDEKPGSLGYYAEPLLDLLPDLSDEESPGRDCDDNPAKARAVAQSILDDWESARAVAEAHGIRFYAVLQPVVYLSKTRRDHLHLSASRDGQFEAVYPLVRAELAARGFADFTEVLDIDAYLYIDYCHVSPNGNALIAQALAELVD